MNQLQAVEKLFAYFRYNNNPVVFPYHFFIPYLYSHQDYVIFGYPLLYTGSYTKHNIMFLINCEANS